MQQNKETPEEMEKRIRASLKAEEPPPVANNEPTFSTAKGKSSSGGDGFSIFNIKFLAAVFIIGLIVSYLVVTFVGVSPLTVNINTVKKTADTALSSATSAVEAANKAQTTANNATNTAQTNLQTAINTLQGNIDGAKASITALQGKSYVTSDQLGKYVTSDQLKGFATSDQIANLQSQLDGLKKQLIADEAQLNNFQNKQIADEAAIAKLQTAAPTTTTTTPVTGGVTTNGITVALTPNPYYGKPVIAYLSGIPVSTSTSTSAFTQQFSFTVTNDGTKNINNLQLAIGLTLYNSAGTSLITLPTDATVTLTTSGLGTTWTNQGYVQASTIGFQNTISSGIFAGLGNISLAIGQSQTFYLNVTVTAGTTNAITPFLISPQVIPLPSI